MERIGLNEAIQNLRAELSRSIREGADQELRFQVGEITLELQLQVEREKRGSGGVKFWVINVGAEGASSSQSMHSLSISLKPVDSNGQSLLTGASTAPE